MSARCSYVLPFRRTDAAPAELAALGRYAADLAAAGCEVVIVDGSPPASFERHRVALAGRARHVPVDPRWRYLNGKVNGVLTGVATASCERVILADDDVVYRPEDVARMCRLLDRCDLVVPQNYFVTLPWWARLETGRILLNRALRRAGDYPGTYAVRRSFFTRIGPYDGDVLFENEAMRRHFVRHGAAVCHARDFMIGRRPPTLSKWREQRLRQAYEDLDLPLKTSGFLLLLPALAFAALHGVLAAMLTVASVALATILVAALGRRGGASAVVPTSACFTAPLWVFERSVMVWAALYARARGGCVYGDRLIMRGLPGDAPA